jgi:MFS family permease
VFAHLPVAGGDSPLHRLAADSISCTVCYQIAPDRLGTRAVVLLGGVLLGLGMVSASQATTLLQFQILFGVLVGVATGSFYAPLTATTTRWFTTNRSLAVALVSAGVSLGSTTIAPLARWVITHYDWRMAMLVVGDIVWVIIIPAALLVREPARIPTAPVPVDGVEGPDLTVPQALRTPQFIAIALTYFACCATHSGPIFHMVTNAIDHGISAMAATTVLSVAGLASLGGKIVCGLIADRVGAKRTLVVGLAIQAVAVVSMSSPVSCRASTRSRSCLASPMAA